MKNLSLLFVFAILLSSCKTEAPKREGYLITGNAPGVYNGIRAYLKVSDQRGRAIPLDTAIVMNEQFVFDGKLDNPNMHFITVDNVLGSMPLILDNGEEITVNIDNKNILNSTITGSESTDLYNSFNENYQAKRRELQDLNRSLRKAQIGKDEAQVKKYTELLNSKNTEVKNFGYDFIDEHADQAISLILLDQQSTSRELDPDRFMKSFSNLSEELKNSKKGKALNQKLTALVEKIKKNEALKVGKKAPVFKAPDENGNEIALNDIKGKVTIIDFWASWCGPCRKENPFVVKVYEKYHDKGLEILGVSLDRPGQKDRWLKAIEDDKLTWNHVSNLQYFNDPVAKLYNISSIPATYIIDEEGTIVAKNLRGPMLENKIAELLD